MSVNFNDKNTGFPVAAYQGIRADDTIVTTGWLRQMVQAMHSQQRIGLVGPCSNNVI